MCIRDRLTAIDQQINLKVLIANVHAENQSYDKVINLVRKEQPDLAIFMEVDKEWQSQLDTLNDLLPYSSGHCSSCNLGMLLYSKQQLNSSKVEFFGAAQNSSVILGVRVIELRKEPLAYTQLVIKLGKGHGKSTHRRHRAY